jgi:hypothetical protein
MLNSKPKPKYHIWVYCVYLVWLTLTWLNVYLDPQPFAKVTIGFNTWVIGAFSPHLKIPKGGHHVVHIPKQNDRNPLKKTLNLIGLYVPICVN